MIDLPFQIEGMLMTLNNDGGRLLPLVRSDILNFWCFRETRTLVAETFTSPSCLLPRLYRWRWASSWTSAASWCTSPRCTPSERSSSISTTSPLGLTEISAWGRTPTSPHRTFRVPKPSRDVIVVMVRSTSCRSQCEPRRKRTTGVGWLHNDITAARCSSYCYGSFAYWDISAWPAAMPWRTSVLSDKFLGHLLGTRSLLWTFLTGTSKLRCALRSTVAS